MSDRSRSRSRSPTRNEGHDNGPPHNDGGPQENNGAPSGGGGGGGDEDFVKLYVGNLDYSEYSFYLHISIPYYIVSYWMITNSNPCAIPIP